MTDSTLAAVEGGGDRLGKGSRQDRKVAVRGGAAQARAVKAREIFR